MPLSAGLRCTLVFSSCFKAGMAMAVNDVFIKILISIFRKFIVYFLYKPLDGLIITDFDILVPYSKAIKSSNDAPENADA